MGPRLSLTRRGAPSSWDKLAEEPPGPGALRWPGVTWVIDIPWLFGRSHTAGGEETTIVRWARGAGVISLVLQGQLPGRCTLGAAIFSGRRAPGLAAGAGWGLVSSCHSLQWGPLTWVGALKARHPSARHVPLLHTGQRSSGTGSLLGHQPPQVGKCPQ